MKFDDVLMPLVPANWENVNPHVSYELKDLDENSEEYKNVKDQFIDIQIEKIQRVQNLYHLGLFKIRVEETASQDTIRRGYHPIYETDLETCMKHPLDYRRYTKPFPNQNVSNQPRIYDSANAAHSAYSEYDFIYDGQKIIVVCDVTNLSDIRRQTDYLPVYVVYIKKM